MGSPMRGVVYALWFIVLLTPGCVPRALQAPPPALQTSGVRVGAGLLQKSVFVQEPSLGSVTDIAEGELGPAAGREIGIAGTQGAVFLGKGAKPVGRVSFTGPCTHVDIIDVEGDGVCEFMNRGSWAVPAFVMDHTGALRWKYGGSPGVDDMAAGDVNGDGKLEFGVGFNGGGGVHLLDSAGHKQWEEPDGNAWHVELVDTDGDERAEVVNSSAGGTMTVRDANGRTIGGGRPPAYFSGFSVSRWPTSKDREYALFVEGDVIRLLRFDASVAKELPAPNAGMLGTARGGPVVLSAGGRPFFATVVEFRQNSPSVLYVHDDAGRLVYQEVLGDSCPSIAAMRLGGAKTETLLVGGTGTVWQYKRAAAAGQPAAGQGK
jgi:hypothetical protein